ncbi:MAG: hypothetical protein KatS3mg105_2088 [Gemmatales bacterium]|nr:MAG: hypothetical protein KatS3mg105_2088 [Gemmatales bacterium]
MVRLLKSTVGFSLLALLAVGCNAGMRRPTRPLYRPTPLATMPYQHVRSGITYVHVTPDTNAVVADNQSVTPAQAANVEGQTVERIPESLPNPDQKPVTADGATNGAAEESTVDEAAAPRRSYADITAHPSFYHSQDYGVLIGTLQYLHVDQSWRLRYASIDEEDRYGGSVTLVETGSMEQFNNGDVVRVTGQFLDPSSREPAPRYRVHSIQKHRP